MIEGESWSEAVLTLGKEKNKNESSPVRFLSTLGRRTWLKNEVGRRIYRRNEKKRDKYCPLLAPAAPTPSVLETRIKRKGKKAPSRDSDDVSCNIKLSGLAALAPRDLRTHINATTTIFIRSYEYTFIYTDRYKYKCTFTYENIKHTREISVKSVYACELVYVRVCGHVFV